MFSFPKMLKVFKDQQMQDDFEKNGFTVAPFYTPQEVAELNKLYY